LGEAWAQGGSEGFGSLDKHECRWCYIGGIWWVSASLSSNESWGQDLSSRGRECYNSDRGRR